GPHNRHRAGSGESARCPQLPVGDDIVDADVPYLAVKAGGKPVENSVASQARRVQVADANDVQTVHLLDDVRPAILAEKDRSRAKCAQGRNPTLKRYCAALVKRNTGAGCEGPGIHRHDEDGRRLGVTLGNATEGADVEPPPQACLLQERTQCITASLAGNLFTGGARII